MTCTSTKNEVKRILKSVIKDYENKINFIALIGSVAKENENCNSDVDILYDLEDCTLLPDLYERLNISLGGRDIDMIPHIQFTV